MDPNVLEANYLDAAWAERSSGRTRRLLILQKLADVIIDRSESEYAELRTAELPPTLDRECFICQRDDRTMVRHHIIQLQHGGSNSRRNLVMLCRACHRDIHPWLTDHGSYNNVRGWTRVGHMLPWFMEQVEKLAGRSR